MTTATFTTEQRQKLATARLWAAHQMPYYATGLYALIFIASPDIETMAVDHRWRVYVDPTILDTWTTAQLGSVLVHELNHVLRDHHTRATNLGITDDEALTWNLATDAEINDDLVANQALDLQDGIVPKNIGCANGKLAEDYYAALAQKRRRRKHVVDCGSGSHSQRRAWELSDTGSGQSNRSPGIDPADADLIRRQVAGDVLSHAKQIGTVPAGLQRWAEELLEPTVDWRRVLAAEIRAGIGHTIGRVDYTYTRPSRRSTVIPGVILPALRRPLPKVAIVVDTSGSMSDHELAQALAEVDGILRKAGVGRGHVHLISCDTDAHAAQLVRTARQVQLVGGGGTDMGKGLAAAADLRPRPDVVVVLTDGYTPWPDAPPHGIQTVVGLIGPDHTHRPPPPCWARVVHIEEEGA